MIYLFIFIILIVSTYLIGSHIERAHYRSIEERERETLNLPLVSIKDLKENKIQIEKAWLVSGSVVISIDYFKRFLAGLINIFGGEVSPYETLLDRARREAILRMKESVKDADAIVNLRLETANIGQVAGRSGLGCVEILAYGTAVTFQK